MKPDERWIDDFRQVVLEMVRIDSEPSLFSLFYITLVGKYVKGVILE